MPPPYAQTQNTVYASCQTSVEQNKFWIYEMVGIFIKKRVSGVKVNDKHSKLTFHLRIELSQGVEIYFQGWIITRGDINNIINFYIL